MSVAARQFYYMLKKCFTLQLRYWKSTVVQVLVVPIATLAVILLLQTAINNITVTKVLNPPAVPLAAVNPCTVYSNHHLCCY